MPELTNDIINTEIQETDKTDSVGYTYILHRIDNPGLVKVGFTAVSSQSRAGNYTDGEWQVHKEFPMPIWLARLTERASHRHLKSYWLDPKITGGTASEIFMCPLDVAVSAVELAFLEELEQVLKSLKVPSHIAQLILHKHGITENSQLSELTIQFEKKEQALAQVIDALNAKFEMKEKDLIHHSNVLERQLVEAKQQLEKEQVKNKELSEKLLGVQQISLDTLSIREHDLRIFADKKINPSQFEVLRDNFRKSIELIETYRIRESMKE
jgi:hypothetical protein